MNHSLLHPKKIRFSFHYGVRLRPVRDWFVLLATFAALLGTSALWNYWLYRAVENGTTLGASPLPVAPALSENAVLQIRAIFTERAAEKARYESGAYVFLDPSK